MRVLFRDGASVLESGRERNAEPIGAAMIDLRSMRGCGPPQGRGLWLLSQAAEPILRSMTQCTITLRGVPIGEAAFDPAGELITVPVHPLPAYGAIRPIVRAASVALADAALGRDGSTPDLRAGAELGRSLELRDQTGALIAADFIDLTEWPGGNPEVAAIIRLRHAFGPVPAVVDPPPRAAGKFDPF